MILNFNDSELLSDITGKVLISTVNLDAENKFFRSLVYVIHQDDENIIGVVFNKKIYYKSIDKLLTGIENKIKFVYTEKDIYIGGNNNLEELFFLHSTDCNLENSILCGKKSNIAVTSNISLLEGHIKKQSPRDLMMILGYTQWSISDIIFEIKTHSWIVAPMDKSFIFENISDDKWYQAMNRINIDYSRMSHKIAE